jgi:hypothetical protein
MYLDSTNDKSGKSIQSVPIFEDGDPETWYDWRCHDIDDLFTFMKIKDEETDKKIQIITSVLQGKALDSFRTYQAEQEAANDKEQKKPWYDEDVLEHTLNDMALEIFPTKHSYQHQVFYMKYHIFIGDGTTVKLFEKRVTNWLNQCLKYFTMIDMTDGQLKTCEPLGEDDLLDIYTLAIKPEWTSKIMESNADPYDFSLTELIDYLVKIEQVDQMKRLDPKKSFKPNKGKHQPTNRTRIFEVITMMNNMTWMIWMIMKTLIIQKRLKHALLRVASAIVLFVGIKIKKISKTRSFVLDRLVNRLKKRRIIWKRSKN